MFEFSGLRFRNADTIEETAATGGFSVRSILTREDRADSADIAS
ncbi:hypothetical protein [Natrarchaeobaculum sulfurireducens]|nr:hypothetical protein [Natrarchaeobaculum sulfurireducens]